MTTLLPNTPVNTMPKTIVLAISVLRIGGAEQFVITLAKGLKALGHNVHILLLHDEIALPVPDDLPIHVFPYDKYRKIPRFVRKNIVAKSIDNFILKNIGIPDLVLSNLKSVDQFLAHSRLDNVYLIVHNTLSKLHQITPRALQQLKRIYLSKPCIGVSKGVTADLSNLFGCAINMVTIYDPVDIEKSQHLATEFIPPYEEYLVNVSSFKIAKRQDVLITAYAKSGLNNPLVLVGDGEKRNQFEQLARQLGVADRVHFIGMTANPYPYINNANAMVISSDFEGLNIAMLEAIALHTPVISTACPSGPPEVLPAHHLVPVGDIDALAEKMQQVVTDPTRFNIALDNKFYPEYAATQYLKLIRDS